MPLVAPNVRFLSSLPPSVLAELPPMPRDGVELFVVTSEGVFDGTTFSVGDVLVCGGETRSGPTVLVARGYGRPRLGYVCGARLLGDAGEPCHVGRWRSAGPLVARYRKGDVSWVIEMLDRGARSGVEAVGGPPAGMPSPDSAAAEGRGERPSAAQLALFLA
jgi:hypothetical protein